MVFDKLKCLDCGSLMIEEEHHGVTLDRCISCGGLWFDVDEIYAYLEAHPGVATVNEPSKTDFKQCTKGVAGACNCCGQAAIELGDFRGIAFQRCTWCGGIFIGWEQIQQILASRAGQVTVWGPEGGPEGEFAPATAAAAGAAVFAMSDTEQVQQTGDRFGEVLSGAGDAGLDVLASGALDGTGEAAGWVLEAVLEFVLGAIAGALGG